MKKQTMITWYAGDTCYYKININIMYLGNTCYKVYIRYSGDTCYYMINIGYVGDTCYYKNNINSLTN